MSPEILDQSQRIGALSKCRGRTLARTQDASFEFSVLRRAKDDSFLALVQSDLDDFASGRLQIIDLIKDNRLVVSNHYGQGTAPRLRPVLWPILSDASAQTKGERHCIPAVAFMVAGGGFEPPTFGLCDLTHLSMRVGLYLHPRGMLAIQSLRLPPPFRGLGSVLPYRSRDVGSTDFDE